MIQPCLLLNAAESSLPDMGSSTSRALSIPQEQALGDDYILAVRRMLPLVSDPLAVDYIKHIGFKLVEQNPDAQDRKFYFFIVQESSLNAFALPGGYIGAHSGLITAAENESELAAVLGHEIAHVTQRHLARRLEKQRQLSFPSLAAFIGAIIVAGQNPEAGIGLMATASAGFQQMIINHTRENEKEADRIGIKSLSAAGFDPLAMASFFEKMQLSTRYLRKPPEFLMTHPVTQNRISDSRSRARELPRVFQTEDVEFHLIKARLLSQQEPIKSPKYLENKKLFEQKTLTEEYDLFYFAMQSIQNGDSKTAITIIKNLLSFRKDHPIYTVSYAEALIKGKQPELAIPFLEKELKTSPSSYPLLMTYARALIDHKQPLAARALLLEHVHRVDSEPQVYQLLAEAQNLSGYGDEVHESHGQYLFKMGDLKGALSQFELALNRRSVDPYATTRVEARINSIKKIMAARLKRH